MKKAHLAAIAMAILVSTNSSAIAGEDGLYLYGSFGQAHSDRKIQSDTVIRTSGITAFTSAADDDDSAYKLEAGYRFNRHLALEGGYATLGRFTYQAASTAPIVATRNGQVDIDGWTLGVAVRAPFSNSISAVAKVGGFLYRVDFTCTGTGVACTNPSRTDKGITTHYAWGLEWAPGEGWLLRAEYEVFPDVGESFNSNGSTGTSRADVRLASIGVGHRF